MIFFKPLVFIGRLSWRWKLFLVLILLGVGLFGISRFRSASGEDGNITATAQKGSITQIVSESGVVSIDGRMSVYSPAKGIVQKLSVKNGDVVEEGQVLFTVKSTATAQEEITAWANYQTAINNLQISENTLRDKQAIVENTLDLLKDNDNKETFEQKQTRTSAEAARDSAFDGVKSAKAQLAAALLKYQETQNATVKAPVGGTVTNLSVIDGSIVNPQAASENPVLLLDGISATELVVMLGENDISKVKEGQIAEIVFDAIEGEHYQGVVKRVDTIGRNLQGVVRYGVYLELSSPGDKIRPGMSADVDIITNEVSDVLLVPNAAVKAYEGGRAVRVAGDKIGEVKYLPVKIGIRGETHTQILEGLSEGQLIIISLSNELVKRSNPFGF